MLSGEGSKGPGPDDFRLLLQAGSRLYMHFARTTLDRFGEAGGTVIRDHLREYGAWRGSEMRQAHAALGLPINMETLNRCWDSASVFIVKDQIESDGSYRPGDVRYDVRVCPAADVWRAEDFHRWGHVYCDEFHQACASTYHPDGNVVIPINMMKGDDHCAFRWVMPEGSRAFDGGPVTPLGEKLAALYRADSSDDAALNALRRTSRLIAGRYWTMTTALARWSSADADGVTRTFLRNWGRQRGELARSRADGSRSALDALRSLDLAPLLLWDLAWEPVPGGLVAVVADTPMDDAWQDLAAGDAARDFWRESLPAYFSGFDPDLRVRFVEERWRGAPATVVEVVG